MDCIVEQTNLYVTAIPTMPLPSFLQERYQWLPKWVADWQPLTEQELQQWLALAIYMACHKTSNEKELWSTHWFWRRPGIGNFMSLERHQRIKAALHFQSADEPVQNGHQERPLIRKIGIFMDLIEYNCRTAYFPESKIAADEITLGFSGVSEYRKQTKHKKSHESIQLWAAGESRNGLQYLFAFDLDRNDGEKGMVYNAIMRLVHKLPPQNKGYKIFMDNLFTSSKLLQDIAALGHGACGTCRASRGLPVELTDAKGKSKAVLDGLGLKEQGDWAFSCWPEQNLLGVAWWDTGIVCFQRNIHAPVNSAVERRKAGVRGRKTFKAPLCASEYNEEMGAIDDIDRVRENLSTHQSSRKWYHTIWWFLLDTCLNNAYTLWCKHQEVAKTGLSMSRRRWYARLCEELLMEAGVVSEQEELAVEGMGKISKSLLPWDFNQKLLVPRFLQAGTAEWRMRLFGGRHFVGVTESNYNRGNCPLCYRAFGVEKKVMHFCKQCAVWMHLECFEAWHTARDPIKQKQQDNRLAAQAGKPAYPVV
eukprot:703946-Rhodomonas_salina.1